MVADVAAVRGGRRAGPRVSVCSAFVITKVVSSWMEMLAVSGESWKKGSAQGNE